ncbi:MAG: hypothetical protein AAF846_29515 [Chloroflexota bacterium]
MEIRYQTAVFDTETLRSSVSSDNPEGLLLYSLPSNMMFPSVQGDRFTLDGQALESCRAEDVEQFIFDTKAIHRINWVNDSATSLKVFYIPDRDENRGEIVDTALLVYRDDGNGEGVWLCANDDDPTPHPFINLGSRSAVYTIWVGTNPSYTADVFGSLYVTLEDNLRPSRIISTQALQQHDYPNALDSDIGGTNTSVQYVEILRSSNTIRVSADICIYLQRNDQVRFMIELSDSQTQNAIQFSESWDDDIEILGDAILVIDDVLRDNNFCYDAQPLTVPNYPPITWDIPSELLPDDLTSVRVLLRIEQLVDGRWNSIPCDIENDVCFDEEITILNGQIAE